MNNRKGRVAAAPFGILHFLTYNGGNHSQRQIIVKGEKGMNRGDKKVTPSQINFGKRLGIDLTGYTMHAAELAIRAQKAQSEIDAIEEKGLRTGLNVYVTDPSGKPWRFGKITKVWTKERIAKAYDPHSTVVVRWENPNKATSLTSAQRLFVTRANNLEELLAAWDSKD